MVGGPPRHVCPGPGRRAPRRTAFVSVLNLLLLNNLFLLLCCRVHPAESFATGMTAAVTTTTTTGMTRFQPPRRLRPFVTAPRRTRVARMVAPDRERGVARDVDAVPRDGSRDAAADVPPTAPSSTVLSSPRRTLLRAAVRGLAAGGLVLFALVGTSPLPAQSSAASAAVRPGGARCADLESCREVGERREEEAARDSPITRVDVRREGPEAGAAAAPLLGSVRYKRLRPGFGDASVRDGDSVDLIFSVSRASGAYMYSRGFGFERDGSNNSDLGMDSYRVVLGGGGGGGQGRDLPVGVERAVVGMKRGERRRIVVPPEVGFETSDWRPEPTTRRGRAQITDYRSILRGRGSSQPPFPAPTIWDVEVMSFRSGK